MSQPVRPVKRKAVALYTEAATARTVTGNTATLTLPDEVVELFVGVNITAVSGTTPTVTVEVQQQDANGQWQTLAATAALSAAGQTALNLPEGSYSLAGGGSWRLRWVVTGTTPSLTFQVGVHWR